MSEVELRDQFVLRVKNGSELDKALRALSENPKTAEEIKDISGMSRTPWLLRSFITDNIDNLSVTAPWGNKEGDHELSYTNVIPSQISIESAEFSGDGAGAQEVQETDMELQFQWPAAPPVIDKMDNFDEPSWFSEMAGMVEEGRHISLQGPPSVGKDTAVEQLSSRKGKPLVTIGGDAGFRKRDLVGSPQMTNGTSYFQIAQYVAAAINGWWVLLSEVNAADADALMYINTQLAPPHVVVFQGKAYPVHEDFRIFISYNHGLIGTKPLPQSFKDRFFSIKVPFFSAYQLERRLEAMGMPQEPHWPEVVVAYGVALWDAHVRGQIRYQVTTRRLIDACTLMRIRPEMSVEDALDKAVIGAIDSPVEVQTAENVLSSVVEKLKGDRDNG